MPLLQIEPDEKIIDLIETETVLEACRKHDVSIFSSCGGVASCGECVVKIVQGTENLSSIGFAEAKLLGNVYHITKERLACQLNINGPVTIDRSAHTQERLSAQSKQKFSKVLVRKKDFHSQNQEGSQNFKQESHEKEDFASKNRLGGSSRPHIYKNKKSYDKK
jgi:ferredoxin